MTAELPFLKLDTHSNNMANAHKVIAHYAELLGISNTRVDNFKELLAGPATQKPNWKLKALGRCALAACPFAWSWFKCALRQCEKCFCFYIDTILHNSAGGISDLTMVLVQ